MDTELIARQAIKIDELKVRQQELIDAIKSARNVLFNVTGPLNGNLNQYNPKQKMELQRIGTALDVF